MPCSMCEERPCMSEGGSRPDGCPEEDKHQHCSNESRERLYGYLWHLRENPTDRIGEVMEYARFKGYTKLGVVFCSGLKRETEFLLDIIKKEGFQVASVMCKAGGAARSGSDGSADNSINTETGYSIDSAQSNPVGQALTLNREEVQLNLIIGLCVGHDTLFMKYADAPSVTIVAKDRTAAHNPAAILYNAYGDDYFGI